MSTDICVWLNLDQLETLEYALENMVMSECCLGHQESAASIYETIQLAAARLQQRTDDEVRRNGEP